MKSKMITAILCAATISVAGTGLIVSSAEMNTPSFEASQPGSPQGQMGNMDGQTPPEMPQGQMGSTDGQAPPQMPQSQMGSTDGQAPPQMPQSQMGSTDGQTPPAMPEGQEISINDQTPPALPDNQSNTADNQNTEGTTAPAFSGTDPWAGSGQGQPAFNNQNTPAGNLSGVPGNQGAPGGQGMQPMNDASHVVAKVTGIDGTTLTVETLKFGEDGTQSTETATYDIGSLTLGEDIKTDSMIEVSLDSDGKVSSVTAGRVPQNGMMPPQGAPNGMAPQKVQFTEKATDTTTDNTTTENTAADNTTEESE